MINTLKGKCRLAHRFAMCAAVFAATPVWADLARDARTTRIVREEGNLVIENALQFERDRDGKAITFETGIQYAPSDRIQLLLEPVLWERQMPEDEPDASGIGDTDFTVAYLAIGAEGLWPAVVLAAKVKIPTADNREIGTGQADYSASVISGKEFGELDLNLELEYETFGSSEGEDLKDQFIYTFSLDYGLTENLSFFAEVFGNTSPADGEDGSSAVLAGVEYDIEINKHVNPFISVEVDTDELITAKVGLEYTW